MTTSNILWNYGHTTIPRHLRDIVVTEYGIADLRGTTDREIVEALVAVMDARFQDAFVARCEARRQAAARLLAHPGRRAAATTRSRLAERFAPLAARGLFAELPFGSDFTAEEIVLAKALRSCSAATRSWPGKVVLLSAGTACRSAGGRDAALSWPGWSCSHAALVRTSACSAARRQRVDRSWRRVG